LTSSTYLADLGLLLGPTPTKAGEILYRILPDRSSLHPVASTALAELWNAAGSYLVPGQQSTRGELFELIVAVCLVERGLHPFYYQAKLALIPETDYDFVLWSESGPVVLSVKTSLRERIKQAALEAVALKMVHRRARCFVLTLDHAEADNAQRKVQSGDLPALSAVIKADTSEFDALLADLTGVSLCYAPTMPMITHSRSVVG